MLDAETEVFSSVWSLNMIRARVLFGSFESIEGHLHAFVPNGVKPELKPGIGTLFCHLVQFRHTVLWQPGVRSIVGIRLQKRGSVRTQGTIHKSFKHGGM